MPKLVYGVGINDSGYRVTTYSGTKRTWVCPFYDKWAGMLERCYSESWLIRQPTYRGCTVIKEWHRFSAFKAWMETQDWEGKHLDKDILCPQNKQYGPQTCVFVTRQLNNFLTDRAKLRGDFPLGVVKDYRSGKFQARVRNPFTKKEEHLGMFNCPLEAHKMWRSRKHELACLLADTLSDTRVAEALKTRWEEKNG